MINIFPSDRVRCNLWYYFFFSSYFSSNHSTGEPSAVPRGWNFCHISVYLCLRFNRIAWRPIAPTRTISWNCPSASHCHCSLLFFYFYLATVKIKLHHVYVYTQYLENGQSNNQRLRDEMKLTCTLTSTIDQTAIIQRNMISWDHSLVQ